MQVLCRNGRDGAGADGGALIKAGIKRISTQRVLRLWLLLFFFHNFGGGQRGEGALRKHCTGQARLPGYRVAQSIGDWTEIWYKRYRMEGWEGGEW